MIERFVVRKKFVLFDRGLLLAARVHCIMGKEKSWMSDLTFFVVAFSRCLLLLPP